MIGHVLHLLLDGAVTPQPEEPIFIPRGAGGGTQKLKRDEEELVMLVACLLSVL